MTDPTASSPYHQPVLLTEAVDGLRIRPDGIYVDATMGGGGHSREILRRLGPQGRLIAFDQDEAAWGNLPADDRVRLVGENFRHLKRFLRLHQAIPVSGILADLGVSSHQFDTAERGFSITGDASLDMRMDRRIELKAADILRRYDQARLQRVFERYGELTNARTLAGRICQARESFPLTTVGELTTVAGGVSKGNPRRYLAQVFQALRIEVNDEFGALGELLKQAAEVLEPAGRLAVITFHSLEDRIVKEFFKTGKGPGEEISEATAPQTTDAAATEEAPPPLRPVHKKPVLPTAAEIRNNPRARSAKLRIAEKNTNP